MKKEDIHRICEYYGIENYTINDDGSIDVVGDVDLSHRRFKKLPLNFRNVTGSFYCFGCNLTSLKSAPSYVGGRFDCANNQLTSLKGFPNIVKDDFYCYDNNLTSLDGAPSSVGGSFHCSYNPLESLKGIPLDLSINKLFLPKEYSYSDYLEYSNRVKRDFKFRKILK